jgi:hypothetical protein
LQVGEARLLLQAVVKTYPRHSKLLCLRPSLYPKNGLTVFAGGKSAPIPTARQAETKSQLRRFLTGTKIRARNRLYSKLKRRRQQPSGFFH